MNIKQVKDIVLDALTKYWNKSKTLLIQKTDVIDNLTNESNNLPLSANQGKVLKSEIDTLNGKLQLIAHPISPKDPDNLLLTCKRIGNKVIVEIGGAWQPFSRDVLIGWSGDHPIIYDANCVRFISGNGDLAAVGYAAIEYNTEIHVRFDRDLDAYGHIRGGFSYYIQ